MPHELAEGVKLLTGGLEAALAVKPHNAPAAVCDLIVRVNHQEHDLKIANACADDYRAKWQRALKDIDEMNGLQIDPEEEE